MRSERPVPQTAEARPSSTVVVARPTAAEPELFMVLRHEESAFGNAWAFPGGVIEDADSLVHDYCTGIDARTANERLGVRSGGLELYSAAIRELYEESGVLLAETSNLKDDPAAVRDAINAGTDCWADFVARNALALRCDKLHYVSHWITPQFFSKRYSTRFFVCQLPPDQHAEHCGGELTACRWATAHAMLDSERKGNVELVFPTLKTLELIARSKTLDELIDWARSCVQWGVTSMLPAVIVRDGQRDIVLPGDKDYPRTLL